MSSHKLHAPLRQMLAVLQAERQALAGFDLEGVLAASAEKSRVCSQIEVEDEALDEECLALLASARTLNEINRQVRNLIAANVAARLDALAGPIPVYHAGPRSTAAYAYAGVRD